MTHIFSNSWTNIGKKNKHIFKVTKISKQNYYKKIHHSLWAFVSFTGQLEEIKTLKEKFFICDYFNLVCTTSHNCVEVWCLRAKTDLLKNYTQDSLEDFHVVFRLLRKDSTISFYKSILTSKLHYSPHLSILSLTKCYNPYIVWPKLKWNVHIFVQPDIKFEHQWSNTIVHSKFVSQNMNCHIYDICLN